MKCKSIRSCYQTKLPETSEFFKEEVVSETLCIPPQKPDMERILDVLVWPEIANYELIPTEVGRSFEGQNLTGYKLAIEILLKQKVTYVANRPEQDVHAAHFEYLKSSFIVVPKEYNGIDICELVNSGRVIISPYVEAVHAKMMDERTIHKCVLVLVDAKIC